MFVKKFRTFLKLYILVIMCICNTHNAKFGSRSRPSGSRPSSHYSRPSYHPSPSHSPSYPSSAHRPFPSPSSHKPSYPTQAYKPFPSHPSPSYHPSPSNPSPGFKPSATAQNPHSAFPSSNVKPSAPVGPIGSVTSRPLGSGTSRPIGFPSQPGNTGHGTVRPIGFTPAGNIGHGTTRRPLGPQGNSNTPGKVNVNPSQSNYPQGPAKPYPTQGYHPGGGYHAPPPGAFQQPGGHYPSPYYSPQHQGHGNYPQYHPPSYGGNTKIKIVNVNNYHRPGYYAPPSFPSYYYTPRDTGSGALGFFLGYSLARITQPSYYHSHYGYDGYSPRYDHYTIHHYHHNRESVPPVQTVQPNAIVTCGGDSTLLCPANTVALCTNNGQLMCVALASKTERCSDNPNVQCIKSTVPCENNDAPECQPKQDQVRPASASISIPCVSSAQVYGNITYVNNTIVVDTPTTTPPPTVVTTSSTLNSTYPITTTETITTTSAPRVKKSDTAQNFCVTILATPAVRQLTEGEKVFEGVENVLSKFLQKTWAQQ